MELWMWSRKGRAGCSRDGKMECGRGDSWRIGASCNDVRATRRSHVDRPRVAN